MHHNLLLSALLISFSQRPTRFSSHHAGTNDAPALPAAVLTFTLYQQLPARRVTLEIFTACHRL